MKILLTRDDFRNAVFKRDNHQCVICQKAAKDAHHIVERRLFLDGGYYVDNGASLCEKHHLEAEMTTLSCEDIREAADIKEIILPDHFYSDVLYDKWGNIFLSNGTRTKGELFFDESVQKILKAGNVLNEFTDKVKYSRTLHFPWSPGMNRDDRMMEDVSIFEGEMVVMFNKMDGENTSWYTFGQHARSLETSSHPSRDYVKSLWAQKGYNIPEGWRVCGENMFAFHSILYCNEPRTINLGTPNEPIYKTFPGGNALDDYFLVFSIWNEFNKCISWEETKEYVELLELTMCPVLYEGIWDMDVIEDLNKMVESNPGKIEGYVVRLQREFDYSEFKKVNGKYVRANHVMNNHGHWSRRKVIQNELKK